MDIRSAKILQAMRSYLLIEPKEIRTFLHKFKFNSEDIDLSFQFMESKYYFFLMSHKYKYTICSLGRNCFPHTESIWNGLKLPNYMFNRGKLFFDKCVSNEKIVQDILSCKAVGPYADSVRREGCAKIFESAKYKILFNHDMFDDALTKEDNLCKFNIELERRIDSLNRLINSEVCLFFHDVMNMEYIPNVYEVIHSINPNHRLIVTSAHSNLNARIEGVYFIDRTEPYQGYIWYSAAHNLTETGYEYETKITNSIVEYIKNNFDKNKNYSSDINAAIAKSKDLGLKIFYKKIRDIYK